MVNFFVSFLQGIALGSGYILPGISSGVLCVIFGIYEKLLNSILFFFNDVKKNLKFIFPIALGSFIGIVGVGKLLNYFFLVFPLQANSLFIGLILISIPSLFKKVNLKSDFKLKYLIFFIFSLSIGIISVYLEKLLSFNSTSSFSFIYLVFCGFLMSIGVVFPGVSSTIILMLLGVYYTYLSAISSVFLPVLVPIFIGLFLGGIIFIKLVHFLLDNYYGETFYSIIGFTVGSIFVLFPNISSITDFFVFLFCILFVFLCFLLIKNKSH